MANRSLVLVLLKSALADAFASARTRSNVFDVVRTRANAGDFVKNQ